MRLFIFAFLLVSLLRAESASVPAHLRSLSVEINPSKAKIFRIEYLLSWSRSSDPSEVNNELVPLFDLGYTHTGFLLLRDGQTFETYALPFLANVPVNSDADANGVSDFFEAAQPISADTEGLYQDPTDPEIGQVVKFKWTRAAGSRTGSVAVEVPQFGLTFPATFAIRDYAGTLEYAKTGTNITATLSTTLITGTDKITAGADFEAASGKLVVRTAVFKNDAGEVMPIEPATDPLEPSGLFFSIPITFVDGSLSNGLEDFKDWVLDFTDLDANKNSVPDIAEGSTVTPPNPPSIAIRLEGNELVFTTTGEIGHSYDLERATVLKGGVWTKLGTVTLNAVTRETRLPAPADKVFFYRLLAL